jgi:DNA-binding beta-propeller fold protein YncE
MDLELASKLSIFLGSVFIILVGQLSSSGFPVYASVGGQGEHYVFMTKWGSLGTGNGQFKNAGGIGVDALGHIYVVDRANFRIEKFSSNGTFITAWGSPGTNNGQLNHTHDIAVYPCGNNLYVADTDNNRIQMFDSHGIF